MVQSLVESRFKEITDSGGSIHSHEVNKEILAVVKRWENLQVMCGSVSPVFQVMLNAFYYMYMYIYYLFLYVCIFCLFICTYIY